MNSVVIHTYPHKYVRSHKQICLHNIFFLYYFRGMPILIEWKTSGKPKLSVKSMFDDPLQVVAYLGALNFDGNYKLRQPVSFLGSLL